MQPCFRRLLSHSSREADFLEVVDSGADSPVADSLAVLEDVSLLILRNRAARCPAECPWEAVSAEVSE